MASFLIAKYAKILASDIEVEKQEGPGEEDSQETSKQYVNCNSL